MKIVVIGGTGLIGSKLVTWLGQQGHEAVAAAPNTGVDTITGEGLAEALAGASAVVDVANVVKFDDASTMEFFRTSTSNLLAAGATAGVSHHVALSIVGSERSPEVGYFRAKIAQETLIENSSIPFSLVHATQFFEFVPRIADEATADGKVHVAPVHFQPIAGDDVARLLGETVVGTPLKGRIDIAGPERYQMDEFFRGALAARNDPREVVTDVHARYFGAEVRQDALVPLGEVTLGAIRYEDWAR